MWNRQGRNCHIKSDVWTYSTFLVGHLWTYITTAGCNPIKYARGLYLDLCSGSFTFTSHSCYVDWYAVSFPWQDDKIIYRSKQHLYLCLKNIPFSENANYSIEKSISWQGCVIWSRSLLEVDHFRRDYSRNPTFQWDCNFTNTDPMIACQLILWVINSLAAYLIFWCSPKQDWRYRESVPILRKW